MTETNDFDGALPYVGLSNGEAIGSPGINVHVDIQNPDGITEEDKVIVSGSTFEYEDEGYEEIGTKVKAERVYFKTGYDVEIEDEEVIVISAGSVAGRYEPEKEWNEFAASIHLDDEDARALRDRLDEIIEDEDPEDEATSADGERYRSLLVDKSGGD